MLCDKSFALFQCPLLCSALGVVKRQSNERAMEVRVDRTGGYLGCLVRKASVLLCSPATRLSTGMR